MANENPWNNKPKQNPQNIDELVEQNLQKIIRMFRGKSSKNSDFENGAGGPPKESKISLVLILLVLLVGYMAYQSVFQVQPGEVGVILRFGKHNRTATPGLNYLIPFVEEVTKVNVEKVRNIDFGFRGQENTNNFNSNSRISNKLSLMLTGDRNVINLNWVVQYRISNPVNFLFKVYNGEALVKDISEFVIRRLVGNRDFDYVLDKREELAFETREEMQEILDEFESGIQLVTVQLLDVTPPGPVRASFNEVNEADQDKTRLINEAQKQQNQEIPKAKGEAEQLIRNAEGYAIERINQAKGDASRFNSILKEYKQYQNVTKTRLYLETMKRVLPTVEQVIVIDEQNNLLPLLNVNKESVKP